MIDSTNPRILADNIRALSGEAGSQASDILALQTYDDEETDTGMKWIDGSTIYRKVFVINSLPNNETLTINHGVTNLGVVTNFYAIQNQSEGVNGRASNYGSTYLLARFTSSNVLVQSTSDLSASSGFVLMEYTKSATPSALNSPAPDDSRSIEPEAREEIPEDEPIEEPVVEVKKTTRKKTITTE